MLLRYEVISLQGICAKTVAANPEVHSEGAVDFLPPLFDDFLTVIIKAQCPMSHCQLIIVGFSLYLHDFHAIVQKLLDYVLQADGRLIHRETGEVLAENPSDETLLYCLLHGTATRVAGWSSGSSTS